jgi:hypothetical protein
MVTLLRDVTSLRASKIWILARSCSISLWLPNRDSTCAWLIAIRTVLRVRDQVGELAEKGNVDNFVDEKASHFNTFHKEKWH